MGKDHKTAAREGTDEIGLAVMATTFAIVAVFVPIAFMSGIIGRFFFQFGVTVAVAVMVSLFVSFTLDPMLSSVWHDPPGSRFKRVPWLGRFMEHVEHFIEWMHRVYGEILEWALTHRKSVLAISLSAFVGSFALVPLIGTEFVPQADQGFISLRLNTPVGSSLEYTDSKVRQVEEALKQFPEITLAMTTVGTDEGRNYARINLKLNDRGQRELHAEGPRARDPQDAAADSRASSSPWASTGRSSSTSWGRIRRRSPRSPTTSRRASRTCRASPTSSCPRSPPTRRCRCGSTTTPRPTSASRCSRSARRCGRCSPATRSATGSRPTRRTTRSTCGSPRTAASSRPTSSNLYLTTSKRGPDGELRMVPLRQVAEIVETYSPQTIRREELQRRVAIFANAQGRPGRRRRQGRQRDHQADDAAAGLPVLGARPDRSRCRTRSRPRWRRSASR